MKSIANTTTVQWKRIEGCEEPLFVSSASRRAGGRKADMSRLTARTETGHAYLVNVKPDEQEVDSPYKNTLQCILDCFERLAQYEDAEEQGRCVVLPCKVGDTVYVLPNYSAYWDDIEETKITGVSQFPTKSGVSNQIVTSIGLCYEWERDFGVRLFSTRAEAEEALENEG